MLRLGPSSESGGVFALRNYSPISPDPGILGRLSVGSSGGSRKFAQEQRNRKELSIKIVAASLMWIPFVAQVSLDAVSLLLFSIDIKSANGPLGLSLKTFFDQRRLLLCPGSAVTTAVEKSPSRSIGEKEIPKTRNARCFAHDPK